MTLKPDMDALSALSAFVGIALVALGATGLIRKAEDFWVAMCRCKIPAYILTTIVLFWSTLWLYVMPLGFVVAIRPVLPILFVVATVLTCIYCKELLMCRAIGGLLVLLPTPLLSSAAWHPSPLRYVMLVFAYAMVVEGMFIVGMPWTLRNQISWAFRNKNRAKVISCSSILLGVVLVCLAFTAYKMPIC
ncbi:MAG: hypothetical protein J6V41_03105 [Kiritimatiellae bacterium]|nr:hypothetical protein [Kiritimatiellia bacterium]